MRFRFSAAAALFAIVSSAPLTAQSGTALSLDQRSTLRCAAAFALVADAQARGNEDALQYPPLGTRGREYFVRTSARIMDDTGMDRAAVAAVIQKEAQDIWDKGTLNTMMPPCLVMLAASGV